MERGSVSSPPARAGTRWAVSRPVEVGFLLDACRSAPGHPATSPSFDWEWLVAAATRHAVLPLLARYITDFPSGAPSSVIDSLRTKSDETAIRNLAMAAHLAELLAGLAGHGIEAMPIKGPALALSAYGNLALREFADLDVIVHPSDLPGARSALAKWGYEPVVSLGTGGESALLRSDHHLPLADPEGRVVELHWALDRGLVRRSMGEAWIWRNARSVRILGGRAIPALSWSSLLVYLCVHGAKHSWARLGWLVDVARVLGAAPRGELDEAARLATAAGASRRLELGVDLACELLGAPLPTSLRWKRDGATAGLAAEVRTGLFGAEAPSRSRQVAFQCRSRDRMLDAGAYCLHLVAAPHVADVEASNLPAGLSGLYYIARPVRLLRKYTAKALRTRNE